MRVFGVTRSPAHHDGGGTFSAGRAAEGGIPRLPLALLPHRPWGRPRCLPVCALALGKGNPTSAPLSPTGATHRHHHPAPAEPKRKAMKQNPTAQTERGPRGTGPRPPRGSYSSDCEREMRGPLRISFRFSSFFLRFSSSRNAFWKVSALGKNSECSILKGLR